MKVSNSLTSLLTRLQKQQQQQAEEEKAKEKEENGDSENGERENHHIVWIMSAHQIQVLIQIEVPGCQATPYYYYLYPSQNISTHFNYKFEYKYR